MRTVGIDVLKNNLSEYVRLASSGETVLVTDRDRVVAELVPPRPERSDRVSDAVVAEGVRAGWIALARYGSAWRRSAPDSDLPLGARPLADILADLDRDRSSR